MPVSSYQIPGGARVLIFTCEDCGAPASFGIGVNIRAALKTGDVSRAGRWFCGSRDGIPICVGRAKAEAA